MNGNTPLPHATAYSKFHLVNHILKLSNFEKVYPKRLVCDPGGRGSWKLKQDCCRFVLEG